MENTMLAEINTQLERNILKHNVYAGELTITVAAHDIVNVMTTLRDTYGFSYLVDIVAIDRYTDEERFEVAYNICNLGKNQRLRVKVMLEEDSPELDSIVPLFPAADWNEREAWDMMGIRFRNHPDLRRIYLPEDFEYHPLRKEFPLIGIPGTLALPNNAE